MIHGIDGPRPQYRFHGIAICGIELEKGAPQNPFVFGHPDVRHDDLIDPFPLLQREDQFYSELPSRSDDEMCSHGDQS
jgi:hypothetical protein